MLSARARVATLGMAIAACTARTPAPIAPTPPPPPAVPILIADGDVAVFAGDDAAAYWAAEGAVWTRTWTGPARRLASVAEPPLALRVHDGAVYAATATTLVALEPTTGAARTIAGRLPPWRVVAIDDDGAWFGTDDGVYRAPLSGGAAEQLASGLGPVDAITTDADAVFAIAQIAGDALVFRDRPQQAIVRIAKADGAVRTLAGKQFGAADLVRLGRRLYWASSTGPSVASVDLDDDRRRIELAGAATRLVTDGVRLIVGVDQETLAELHDGVGLVADGAAGWALELAAAGMAAAGDGVLALRRRPDDGAAALWWLPRPSRTAAPARLITATGDRPLALALDDDTALYQAARAGIRIATGNRAVRVVAFDRRRGTSRELARGDRSGAVAIDGARRAFGLDGTLWLSDGGGARALARGQHEVTGVAIDGDRVWWSDGQALWRSDTATAIWQPDWNGRGTAYAAAPLVRTTDGLVFSELGLGAEAIRRAGATVTVLDDPGPDVLGSELVRVGDTLVTTTRDAGSLRVVPLTGGAAASRPSTDDSTEIVRLLGGPALLAITNDSDGPTLVDVDLATGARRRRWGVPGGFGLDAWTATSDDAHVYAFLQRAGWLIAIPR